MSQILTKSPKHCGHKRVHIDKVYKKFFYVLSSFSFTVLLLILLVYLILHPTKPSFSLTEADIYQLNLSGSRLNSSIQISLLCKNPNGKVGIYYDELQAYASYKGQQITLHASLPPFYQGTEDSSLLTANLIGAGVPVAASFGYELGRDQAARRLTLSVKLSGRLRWKVGTWVSGKYRLNVNCVSLMEFGPNIPSGPLSSKQGNQCSTSL